MILFYYSIYKYRMKAAPGNGPHMEYFAWALPGL